MNNSNNKKNNTVKLAGLVCVLVILACTVTVGVFYFLTKYQTLLLLSIVLFMPAFANLVLFIPFGKPKQYTPVESEPEQEKLSFFKKIGRFFKRVFRFIAKTSRKLAAFCAEGRTAAVISLCALTVVISNIVFWLNASKNAEHKLNFIVPIILAAIFVVFIVLDKWCRYIKNNAEPGYYTAVIHNLIGIITFAKVLLITVTVISVMCVLKLVDLGFWLNLALCLFFLYETLFLALSIAVRMIRNEINTNPDLYIPLPGRRGEDLSLISYLEENTGITMRSLWSMRLIKQIIPYTVMLSVLVLWLSTGIVYIESYQDGALYRLGKLQTQTLSPGLHITLPWPFDKTEIYDTENVNEITIGYLSTDATDNLWTESHGNNEYKLLLGGGNELVSINLRVEYRISDLQSYLRYSSSPVSLLESAAYETVTAATINTDLNTLLSIDRTQFSKSFAQNLKERISKYNTGLEIVSVVIESIHPPIEVAGIYQQIISAGIQSEKLILDAKATAGVTVAEAQTEHDKAINFATASNYKNVAAAKASVAEFMASVEADDSYGDGYRYYKYLEAIKKAYKDSKLIIVGQGIDSKNIYFGNITGVY